MTLDLSAEKVDCQTHPKYPKVIAREGKIEFEIVFLGR